MSAAAEETNKVGVKGKGPSLQSPTRVPSALYRSVDKDDRYGDGLAQLVGGELIGLRLVKENETLLRVDGDFETVPEGVGVVLAERREDNSWPGLSVQLHPECNNPRKECKIVWRSDAPPPEADVDWTWEDDVEDLIEQLQDIRPDLEAPGRKITYFRCFCLPPRSPLPRGIGVERHRETDKPDSHNHATMFAEEPQRAEITRSFTEPKVGYIHISALAEAPLNWEPHSIVQMSRPAKRETNKERQKRKASEGRVEEAKRRILAAGGGEAPSSSSRSSTGSVAAPPSSDTRNSAHLNWEHVADALQVVWENSSEPSIIDQALYLGDHLDVDEEGESVAPQELGADALRHFAQRVHRVLLAFQDSRHYRVQTHEIVSTVRQQLRSILAKNAIALLQPPQVLARPSQ